VIDFIVGDVLVCDAKGAEIFGYNILKLLAFATCVHCNLPVNIHSKHLNFIPF
jgi:hypothetical protein